MPWSWLAALAGLQLLLDVALAPRVMGEGDAAEFTLTLVGGGVPHPPGYPLYILFGHAFVHTLHALGCGWAFAANLWSAAGATVATLLTAAVADRLIPDDAGLGRAGRLLLVAAALLALVANPVFLRAATQAEVYSWHSAWVAGSALVALALWRAFARRESMSARRVRLIAFGWGALTGAGIAQHLTAVFFAAPLGLLLAYGAMRARRLDVPAVLALVGGLAIPLLSYGFVGWRALHPAAFQWPALEPTLHGVFMHATGAIYRTLVGSFSPSEAEQKLLLEGVAPVVIPGLFSILVATWRARREVDAAPLLALMAAAGLQLAFTLRYAIADPSAYFLPLIVVSVAAGTRLAADLTARLVNPLLTRGFALVAMSIAALAWVTPEFEHVRRLTQVDRDVRAAFRALPFERGIVVWNSDSYVRLRAYQILDGDQTGWVVINPSMLTWAPAWRAETRRLGFDPLAGLRLESDADLAGVAPNIARQTPLPVVDFATSWAPTPGPGPAESNR